ncbi:hypothetical protein BH10PAT1_BH10PAT1_2780 [soil metagenome]
MEQTQSNQDQTSNVNPNVGFPSAPTQMPSNAPKKNWKWLIILVLFLVVIGGVTYFVFKSSRSAGLDQASPTPDDNSSLTAVQTPAPTSTPSASPSDKTQINISVLNGTGVAGEAGVLSDALTSLGYTSITTGNAPTQDSTDTQVTFSSTVGSDVTTEITAKLNALYTNVTTNNSTLPSGTDIQITTGSRKGQTSAPAATDSPEPTATP